MQYKPKGFLIYYTLSGTVVSSYGQDDIKLRDLSKEMCQQIFISRLHDVTNTGGSL